MAVDVFGALHGVVVIAASLLGLGAATLAVLGLGMARRRTATVLGAATMAAGLFDVALYASHFAAHTPDSLLTPAFEKVALALLLAWMVTVARSLAS
jgi:hypothetical protein